MAESNGQNGSARWAGVVVTVVLAATWKGSTPPRLYAPRSGFESNYTLIIKTTGRRLGRLSPPWLWFPTDGIA
jgi:hypothetical protein